MLFMFISLSDVNGDVKVQQQEDSGGSFSDNRMPRMAKAEAGAGRGVS